MVLQNGDMTLDTDHQLLFPDGRKTNPIKLTPMECRLLATLMGCPDQVISHAQLMNKVWHTDYVGDTRTLHVHICWLRRKIEADPSRPCRILTHRSLGYELKSVPDQAFLVDNAFPGGEPRTIGFWKNWNGCTGGNQAATAAENGGPDAGWYILDDVLNDPGITIGVLHLDGADCADAVTVLDKRQITGNNKKMASDAAYNLASQLLAAKLNLSVGAHTCQATVDAVHAGQSLLASISFDGSGNYLRPKDGQLYDVAIALAAMLDNYNNGMLCTP